MLEGTTHKKGKGRSKGQEGLVSFRIRYEMIKELEALADSEELPLSAYVRQLLKHEVVAKNTPNREFEQFRESQRGLHVPKSGDSRRILAR